MSTHGIVAVPSRNGWCGRYAHWDGYPVSLGVDLQLIVRRDGLSKAVSTLHAHGGWSSIDACQPPAAHGRFVCVEGYGLAYAPDEQPRTWICSQGDTWGAMYAYVLGEGGIIVHERRPEAWRRLGFVRYEDQEGMEILS